MPEGGRLTIETANTHLDEAYALQHQRARGPVCDDRGIGYRDRHGSRQWIVSSNPSSPPRTWATEPGLALVRFMASSSSRTGTSNCTAKWAGHCREAVPAASARRGTTEAEGEAAWEEPDGGSGELVLVVEDDEAVRAYSVDSLRELGYRVIAATNGPEGLDLLARYPAIRLLFTDVGLPGGMTGRQLADQARRATTGAAGAVHHRLCAQCDRPWWHA